MLNHEEQLRINDLIVSIEDYYFSTADYENFDPSAEKPENHGKPGVKSGNIWKEKTIIPVCWAFKTIG